MSEVDKHNENKTENNIKIFFLHKLLKINLIILLSEIDYLL